MEEEDENPSSSSIPPPPPFPSSPRKVAAFFLLLSFLAAIPFKPSSVVVVVVFSSLSIPSSPPSSASNHYKGHKGRRRRFIIILPRRRLGVKMETAGEEGGEESRSLFFRKGGAALCVRKLSFTLNWGKLDFSKKHSRDGKNTAGLVRHDISRTLSFHIPPPSEVFLPVEKKAFLLSHQAFFLPFSVVLRAAVFAVLPPSSQPGKRQGSFLPSLETHPEDVSKIVFFTLLLLLLPQHFCRRGGRCEYITTPSSLPAHPPLPELA